MITWKARKLIKEKEVIDHIKNAGKMTRSLLTLIDLFQWRGGSDKLIRMGLREWEEKNWG